MTDDKDKVIVLKKKADAYFLLKEKVHITYLTGHWVRGFIEEVRDEFFILEETFDGKIPVFYQEIKDISKFTEAYK
jgi:hypothetical protein